MDISIPGLVIVCGLQGSGKSHLIKYLMYQNRKKFDWGIVFSHTAFAGGNFDYVDPKFVHRSFSQAALKSLKELHAGLVEAGKKPSGFIIFDDCLDKEQWNSSEFSSLMLELRHYGITCIISCQFPYLVPPRVRSQIFQAVMFEMEGQRALNALYESYGQRFDNYTAFKKYLLENTGDHQFIFYNRAGGKGAGTVENRYQVMACPAEIPKFKLTARTRL